MYAMCSYNVALNSSGINDLKMTKNLLHQRRKFWVRDGISSSKNKYPELISNTFQYIPISKTLKSLFRRPDFSAAYKQYNYNKQSKDAHICAPGVYKSFCCGKTFKSSDLYQNYPASLQLHIASDDFQPTNPLLSKGSVYKICAIYFTVQNVPHRILSKSENIFLVSLCFSDDLKTKEADFNDIWNLIVKDISYLESSGINIDLSVPNLKGSLALLSFDNLGAHTSLGFAGSLTSKHPCRICECEKSEVKQLTRSDTTKYRNQNVYES